MDVIVYGCELTVDSLRPQSVPLAGREYRSDGIGIEDAFCLGWSEALFLFFVSFYERRSNSNY